MDNPKNINPTGSNMLSASKARVQLDSGEISSEKLVQDCLDRIKTRDADIDAWVYLDPELALEQAKTKDKETPKGLLHGIPIGIKDIYDTYDMPTGYGTEIHKNHQPDSDSNWVKTLREAGAVIIGKTRTTEFANPYPTITRNPHDLERSPGVSSSGSAAAVADFMVPLATGSQTGGSVIKPAAFCGIYGYKPSFDGLPTGGVRHSKPSIDTPGFFTRCLEDVALMRAASLNTPINSLELKNKDELRVGICKTEFWSEALPETASMIAEVSEILSSKYAKVEEVDLPIEVSIAMKEFRTIVATEDAKSFSHESKDHLRELNPWTQKVYNEAKSYTNQQYENAKVLAARGRTAIDKVFNYYDVLITPSARGEATKDLMAVETSYFNSIWTLMYLPCLTLPIFKSPSGLPLGIQLVCRRDCDDLLLAIGRSIEQKIKQ